MAIESSTTISGLNALWPLGTDIKAEGDNHIRLIKSVLKSSFNDSGTGMNMATVANRGLLWGLMLSNNGTDAVNSIDVAAGSAASDDTLPWMINLAGGMTKKTNAAWAAGSGNGGFDGGAMPNTSGAHVFLIGKSTDLTAADIFISANLTPTLPSGWDRKRRLGWIIRDATQIRPFLQRGNRFLLGTSINQRTSTAAQTDVLVNFSGPIGVRFRPIVQSVLSLNASSNAQNFIFDGDGASSSGQNGYQSVQAGTGGTAQDSTVFDHVYTNTAQQLRFTCAINSGTIAANNLNTLGWWDDRGMLG